MSRRSTIFYYLGIIIVVLVATRLEKALHLPGWVVWMVLLVAITVAIVDYYWFKGRLNGGTRYYGKK